MKTSKPSPHDSPYLTPREAAAILKVDRRTVYEWLRSGSIPAIKFGHSWRIRRDSLAA